MYDFMDMDFGNESTPTASAPYLPEASDCMRCGLCVNGCPTFRLFQIQEESPRSRVRTLSKILLENESISAKERQHLDNCVQCRACETICPSKMQYGDLFDQAQAKLAKPPQGLAKWALALIAHKNWRARLMPWLALYLHSGLQKPLRQSGILKKLGLADAEAMLNKPAVGNLAKHYPSSRAKQGQVALFTGCIGEHFDRTTLDAAIKLLNAVGFDVIVPSEQGCCGAIHQHNGQDASALIEHNIAVFNSLEVDAVIHTATGCGAMLSEYPKSSSEAATFFGGLLHDISDFLLTYWPEDLKLLPLPEKIAVHESCSQRNVLKNQQSVYDLLAKIPELEVQPLADNALCCGAGGSYMLTHPDNASQLRTLKLKAINAVASKVVSSNYACAAFLNASGESQISHPLQVLAGQLP
jgi:glycolate oxidase iron-sulfur subunit